MGASGKESVAQSFTWDVIAGQTIGVYNTLPGMVSPAPTPIPTVAAQPKAPPTRHPPTFTPPPDLVEKPRRAVRRGKADKAVATGGYARN